MFLLIRTGSGSSLLAETWRNTGDKRKNGSGAMLGNCEYYNNDVDGNNKMILGDMCAVLNVVSESIFSPLRVDTCTRFIDILDRWKSWKFGKFRF